MGIESVKANVFYAPTKKRRYFSRQAAINGEATAIILKRHPLEPFESDTGAGYDIRIDEPDRYEKMHRRLCRIIKNVKTSAPQRVINSDTDAILQSNVEASIDGLITDRKVKYIADTLEFVEGLKIGLEIAGLYGDDIKALYSKSINTS
jgi:hypothetical protein